MSTFGLLQFIFFVLLVCYLIAWYMGMQLITDAAKRKGRGEITGKLWFIGFFGLIVTSAAIVAALPDRNATEAADTPASVEDELPEI